jgi:hypothetical protein
MTAMVGHKEISPSPASLTSEKPRQHEYALPWTRGKLIPDEESLADVSKLHFVQRTLGVMGLVIIIGGTIVTLSIFAFLAFLWFGEGAKGGQNASWVWRWFMLGQKVTQAITLSTVVMRIATMAQASIYTSLVAAVILEKYGVPLSRVAEVSIIRSTNDGPFRLAWLLSTSARKSAIQALLVVTLLFTTVSIQFSSTILVSDLDFSTLVAEPRNKSLPLFMTTDVISLNHQVNNWLGRPTAYVPFGEVPSATDSTPTQLGASDSGIVRRVFLPVPQNQRTTLRRYKGQGFVLNSRFVCVRPVAETMITITVPPPFTATIPFFLQIHGNISYEQTLNDAGLALPANCPDGRCFPSKFNCSLPQFQYQPTAARQGFTDSLCLPDGANAVSSAKNFTLAKDPIMSYSEVFLFFRSNGTYDLWRGPNGTVLQGNFRLRNISYTQGEWNTYERAIGGIFADGQRDNGVLRMDMSMCFQQVAFDFSDVEVSTDRDLSEPAVPWNAEAKSWDTSKVRKMLGTIHSNETTSKLSASQRGIYTVDSVTNGRHLNATQFFTNKLINNLYNSPNSQNISMFMDPQGSGRSNFLPHIEYQALFADILNATNRPGIAMQATLSALSGSIVNEAIPQFDAMGTVAMTSSVLVLAPRHFRGLVAVAGVVFLNLCCGTAITCLFLLRTRYSSQGNHWHAVSQIVSEHTAWIVESSTRSTDGVVEGRLEGVDPEVRIALSERTGRVQVVMKGFKG